MENEYYIEKLNLAMKKKTRYRVAKELGISWNTLTNWLKGRTKSFSLKSVEALDGWVKKNEL